MIKDERQLIDSIKNGDREAFTTIVHDYKALVYHIVSRYVRTDDREDICQDIFVKVYRNLDSFRLESKLATWIGRIAYNTCMNYAAKKKMLLREDLDMSVENTTNENPYVITAHRDMRSFLQQLLDRLPPIYRTILTLFHLQELSYAEIGVIMDLPEGTVKSYLFRARGKMRMLLEKCEGGSDLC